MLDVRLFTPPADAPRRIAADFVAFALARDGLRNYSLAMMPERVLRRAFVPAPSWPFDDRGQAVPA